MAGRSSTRTASSSRQPKPQRFSDKWDLTHLVKNPTRQLDAHLAELEAKVVQIEAARPGLSPAMPNQDL
ncbi:MAG: oligoendopeptidase F, partial [Nitrospirota bacterium]